MNEEQMRLFAEFLDKATDREILHSLASMLITIVDQNYRDNFYLVIEKILQLKED